MTLQVVNSFVDFCTQFISDGGFLFGFFLVFLESFVPVLPLGVFVALNVNAFGGFFGIILSWTATCLGCFLSYLLFSFLSEKLLKTILANGSGNYKAKSEIDLKIARPLCSTMHKMHRACQDNYVTDNGKVRRLTPREAARLQGFPDDFVIPVSDTQAYRQFGNAVTVNVARSVAKSIMEVLNEEK